MLNVDLIYNCFSLQKQTQGLIPVQQCYPSGLFITIVACEKGNHDNQQALKLTPGIPSDQHERCDEKEWSVDNLGNSSTEHIVKL